MADEYPPGLSPASTKAGKLQRAIWALYREHQRDGMLPTSGRFIWYELLQRAPDLVKKERARGHDGVKRGVDQDVTDALTILRERKIIPWADIVDETRSLYKYVPTGSGAHSRSASPRARDDSPAPRWAAGGQDDYRAARGGG
jgi:hypothetical protein